MRAPAARTGAGQSARSVDGCCGGEAEADRDGVRALARVGGRLRLHRPADGVLPAVLHLSDRLRVLHQPLQLADLQGAVRRLGELSRALPRRGFLAPRRPQHARLHGVRRAPPNGARPRARGRRQPVDPFPDVLPRRVLLPVARRLRCDRLDRDLHPRLGRALQHDPAPPRLPPHERLVHAGEHRPAVDHRPERLDDVRHDDALLPRRVAGDPRRRLRGRRNRRRGSVADVLEGHLPAAEAGPFLRPRRLDHRLTADV